MQVHSEPLELINPDSRCFELGRPGLGIDGIDREVVGCHLIVEMKRQKSKTWPQPWVKSNRSHDRATARTDTHSLAFAKVVAGSIFGRKIESFVAAQWRRVARGLHSGVVRVEATACREPDRVLLVQLIHRRLEFHGAERRARPKHWSLPQAAMEKHLPRMRFVVAR